MTDRKFERIGRRHGDRTISVQVIRCAVEGCTEIFELPDTGRVPMPPDAVGSKARRGGWKVGRNASRDRCPAHIHNRGQHQMPHIDDHLKIPERTRQVLDTHTVAKDGVVTLLAERAHVPTEPAQPRIMDREEKRILFGELDAAYQDAEHGYKPGHTDKTVADALGVPVVWVRQLREEMFGPAEGDKTLKEMAALLQRQIALETSIDAAKETFAALLKEAHSISIRLTDLKKKG
jgi:hypothetical protein